MNRSGMLQDAAALVADADDMCRRIVAKEPGRAPIARVVVDEAVRVYFLIETHELTPNVRREIAYRLRRANVLAKALMAPIQ